MSAFDIWLIAIVGTAAFIILIALFWFRTTIKELRSGTPTKDERTRYVEGRAALFAVYTNIAFLVALMSYEIVATELGNLPMLSAGYVVPASVIFLGGTYFGMRLYLDRVGEPEE